MEIKIKSACFTKDEMNMLAPVLLKINRFLFQWGHDKETRKKITEKIFLDIYQNVKLLDSEIEEQLFFQKAHEESCSFNDVAEGRQSHDSNVLVHSEDRQLHELITQLPKMIKTGIVLSCFHFLNYEEVSVVLCTTRQEAEAMIAEGKQSIVEQLESIDGQGMTLYELDNLLKFLQHSYKKVDNEVDVHQFFETLQLHSSEKAGPEKKRPSKLPLVAAGLFMTVAIGIAYLNEPATQQSSNDEAVSAGAAGMSDEEVRNEIQNMANRLGLKVSEAEELEYVKEIVDFNFTQAGISSESNSGTTLFAPLGFDQFATPLEYLVSQSGAAMLQDEVLSIMRSEEITEEYIRRADMVKELYIQKLKKYEGELQKLDIQEINQFAFSNEAVELINKISENGYSVIVNPENDGFMIEIGGEVFDEAAQNTLTESYIQFIKERKHTPYIEDGVLKISTEQVSEKLLFLEETLLNMAYDMPVANQLLNEYHQLLWHFIQGSAEESIFTEDGALKQEVKSEWEQMITDRNLNTYATSRLIRLYYTELEQNDFQRYEGWEELIDRMVVSPVKSMMTTDQGLYPLKTELRTKYNMYGAFEDDWDLTELFPNQIAHLYLFGITEGNAKFVYNIVAKTEEHPTLEELERNFADKDNNMLILNEVKEITQTKSNEELAEIEVSFKDGRTEIIRLREEGVMWKVIYDPAHVKMLPN